MLYTQKNGLCVSCYLAAILALYMHQFCVTGPFKYRCMLKNDQSDAYGSRAYTLLIFLTSQNS